MSNAIQTGFAAGFVAGRAASADLAGGFQLALGILAEFRNALNAGPFAGARLPDAAQVSLGRVARDGGVAPEPGASWTASLSGAHTGRVDLGDGYRLEIDERNSEMTIFNGNTGERTRIWGDPHVEVDGRHAFDFWGTTTFQLENGAKITINTEQWNGNPNMYVAAQVVITKGANAIIVDGISQNRLGDLSVTQSHNGHALDGQHRDGFVLHENATGAGWRSEHTGKLATQDDLNATRVGAEYGPGSQAFSLAEASGALSLWLLAGSMGALFHAMTPRRFDLEGVTAERSQSRERTDFAARPWALQLLS